jgi:DNA-binding NarL/FixJ family response regulator
MIISKPSIIFIEDHAVMRKGLASWFAASERWQVTGTASSLETAKELFVDSSNSITPSLKVDIMLLDIELKDGMGLDIIPWLAEQNISCPKIAVYSNFETYAYVKLALNRGAKAYISKSREESEVEAALIAALNGELWIDPIVWKKNQNTKNLIDLLSAREFEILILLKRNFSNKQISDSLFISTKTVANHISNMNDKTGTHSRLELQNL